MFVSLCIVMFSQYWHFNFYSFGRVYFKWPPFVKGFPTFGVEWQKMENPDLHKTMGMKPGQKEVCIKRIEPTASEYHYRKPSNVTLSFDGIDIANDGTGDNSSLSSIYSWFFNYYFYVIQTFFKICLGSFFRCQISILFYKKNAKGPRIIVNRIFWTKYKLPCWQ